MTKPFTLTVGPFVGMNDALNLSAQDATRAAYLENVYGPQTIIGADLISRPGYGRVPLARPITGRVSWGTWTLTGKITFTALSAAVIGTAGTLFTTELFPGEFIENTADGTLYKILSIADDTHLTLVAPVTNGEVAQTEVGSASSSGTATGLFVQTPDSVQIGDALSIGTTPQIVTTRTDAQYFLSATGWNGGVGGFTNTGETVYQGGAFGGRILGVWQHTRTDATYHRFLLVTTTLTAVNGGGTGRYRFLSATSERIRLLEYDPSAAILSFTDRTSTSMNGVLLDDTTRIYATTFANYFIVTDGVNRPRKVDFSSYPGTLTNLTDGNYAMYGPPAVYYGKLFFLDASDRVTARWSEENDPDTGYGTGSSDNSWTLRQTSPDQIEVMVGTNAALYVFRQNSITSITGASNSDFKSSGTLDDISTTIGTRSPDGAISVNQSVIFMDQYGRPGRIEPGYGYLPLYDRCIETLRGVPTTTALLRQIWARLDGALNLVKIGYPALLVSTRDEQMLTFDSRSWECIGLHKIPDGSGSTIGHDFGTQWLDENIFPRYVVASGQTNDLAVYIEHMEDTQQASAQDSTLAGTNLTVQGIVTTPKLGGDPLIEKRFTRLSVGTRNVGGFIFGVEAETGDVLLTESGGTILTESGWDGLALVTVAEQGPYASYGAFQAMTTPGGSYAGASTKAERGVNVTGRWAQFQLTNDVSDGPLARFTVDTVTVTGVTVDDHPGAR